MVKANFLLEISPSHNFINMLHFVRTFSIYACVRLKDFCYIGEVRDYGSDPGYSI